MSIHVEEVTAILLRDGWHNVSGFGIDEYADYLSTAYWDEDAVPHTAPITSILAVRSR